MLIAFLHMHAWCGALVNMYILFSLVTHGCKSHMQNNAYYAEAFLATPGLNEYHKQHP